MAQPIPTKIKNKNPNIVVKTYNTLLIDGSNVLELSLAADKKYEEGIG